METSIQYMINPNTSISHIQQSAHKAGKIFSQQIFSQTHALKEGTRKRGRGCWYRQHLPLSFTLKQPCASSVHLYCVIEPYLTVWSKKELITTRKGNILYLSYYLEHKNVNAQTKKDEMENEWLQMPSTLAIINLSLFFFLVNILCVNGTFVPLCPLWLILWEPLIKQMFIVCCC